MAKRKRHTPEEMVRELQAADVMLRAETRSRALQKLETTETTYDRWRVEFDGRQREQLPRLDALGE